MTVKKLIVIVIAAIYVISPVDAIPEFAPVVGWVDDALVGGVGAATAVSALLSYFRRKSTEEPDSDKPELPS